MQRDKQEWRQSQQFPNFEGEGRSGTQKQKLQDLG